MNLNRGRSNPRFQPKSVARAPLEVGVRNPRGLGVRVAIIALSVRGRGGEIFPWRRRGVSVGLTGGSKVPYPELASCSKLNEQQ
jgi:hypothetical protein